MIEMMKVMGKDPDAILSSGHSSNWIRSDLIDATQQFRYELWGKGQLKLGSTVWVPPPVQERIIDPIWFEMRDKGKS